MSGTNPTDELEGLYVAISAACADVITRPVSVRQRDYDGFWGGPWPLIVLRLADFNLQRISGGQLGTKGQQGREQNFYSIEIQDVIDPRDTGTDRVAASQDDLYRIITAIAAYFDHSPHQLLPVAGVPTCTRAGEYLRFRLARPFTAEDGGEVRVVVAGVIGVLGLPRLQAAT